MKEIINQHTHPLDLEDGTVLGAAGSEGSVRHVESISDADVRRLVNRGLIAVRDVEFKSTAASVEPAASSTSEGSEATKREKR